MRPFLHYLAAAGIIALYGGQICPFIDSLSLHRLALEVFAVLGGLFLVRPVLQRLVVEQVPFNLQTGRTMAFEFLLFLTAGSCLTIFHSITYHFPMASGLKLTVAMATLGFFAATDLALERQRLVTQRIAETGQYLDPEAGYFPLPGKLAGFASLSAIFVLCILFLVINRDLDWLVEAGTTINLPTARRAVLLEIGFVLAVILVHILNIIFGYTRNLQTFFDYENGVLVSATGGDLTGSVPVGTRDEFGIMARHTNIMIDSLRSRTEELLQTRDVTILSLATLAETRDNETGAHILRTQRYVGTLARYLRGRDRFRDYLTGEIQELLFKSAPLHDIGKVGIPDRILLKPGRLTAEEFEIMKQHAVLGGDALGIAEERLGSNSFLQLAREIAYTHHEKWDGSGYPAGLAAEHIPLSGRLMALADVYDALISKRVYKPAFSHRKAAEIIRQGRGTHFDPEVVEAFVAQEREFQRIAREFSDSDNEEIPATDQE